MTAVAGPDRPLLFPEPQLVTAAVDLLSMGGEFLQTRRGDVQAELDLCADGRGLTFSSENIRDQFLRVDVLHNVVRRAAAEFGFCYDGEDAECELVTSGYEFGKKMLQQLILENGHAVLEVAEEEDDSKEFDALLQVDAGAGMITDLAKSAFEAADKISDETAETPAGVPETPEGRCVFLPHQGEAVLVLGRLSRLAAEALLDCDLGISVNSTVCLDCGPAMVYERDAASYEGPANLVNIWTSNGKGRTTLFHFDAKPERDMRPGFAIAHAYVEITHKTAAGHSREITRLLKRDGELRSVTKLNDAVLGDDRVMSWQSAVESMATQAVAASRGKAA